MRFCFFVSVKPYQMRVTEINFWTQVRDVAGYILPANKLVLHGTFGGEKGINMYIYKYTYIYIYVCTYYVCTIFRCSCKNSLSHTAMSHVGGFFPLVYIRTNYNTQQHIASHWNKLQHTAAYCHTLPHTATRCNTLPHAATHCNTLQHSHLEITIDGILVDFGADLFPNKNWNSKYIVPYEMPCM